MGLSKLGFLNPLLYQTAASTPTAFNDIVSGPLRTCTGEQRRSGRSGLNCTALDAW